MMKSKNKILIVLVLTIMIAWLTLRPWPVSAALGILSIQPSTISNTSATELVVTGTDFVDGARVLIEQVGALPTSFVSPTVLVAIVPAGLPPGIYTVTVINPDSSSASLQNALTITAPQETPVPTPDQDSFYRPVVVVSSYSTGQESVAIGTAANLQVRLYNKGQKVAFNVTVSFAPGDFVPLQTGGVLSVNEIDPGETKKVTQPFMISSEAVGKKFATVVMTANYTDQNNTVYTETFNLNIAITSPTGVYASPTPTPTATSIPNLRPQILISEFGTEPVKLEPGLEFNLSLTAENVGKGTAQRTTMILGGGSSSGGNAGEGTPDAGGVSGGSSSLTNFAPLDSSNVQFLGDIAIGQKVQVQARLIVNTTTPPGAYTLPISFTYVGENGGTFTDDQVVTLLVYTPPKLEASFYRDPNPILAGQPNILPVQIVNLGRQMVVLGNMTVTAPDSIMENNTVLIGPLDPGGYFTLDAMMMPNQAGPLELLISINYSDDFNQPEVFTDTIEMEVQESFIPPPEPGEEGGETGGEGIPQEPEPETIWQKFVRFLRGLFGLDSAAPTPESVPVEEVPPERQPMIVPVKPAPKG
jgi:hypothetical protein